MNTVYIVLIVVIGMVLISPARITTIISDNSTKELDMTEDKIREIVRDEIKKHEEQTGFIKELENISNHQLALAQELDIAKQIDDLHIKERKICALLIDQKLTDNVERVMLNNKLLHIREQINELAYKQKIRQTQGGGLWE